jgi:hypothetical protein
LEFANKAVRNWDFLRNLDRPSTAYRGMKTPWFAISVPEALAELQWAQFRLLREYD